MWDNFTFKNKGHYLYLFIAPHRCRFSHLAWSPKRKTCGARCLVGCLSGSSLKRPWLFALTSLDANTPFHPPKKVVSQPPFSRLCRFCRVRYWKDYTPQHHNITTTYFDGKQAWAHCCGLFFLWRCLFLVFCGLL